MSEAVQFSNQFYEANVAGQKQRINDLLSTRPEGKSLFSELQSIFPDLSGNEIRSALETNLNNLPEQLAKMIAPWVVTNLDLPSLSVVEISRRLGISPSQILSLTTALSTFTVEGQTVEVRVVTPQLERFKKSKQLVQRRSTKGTLYTELTTTRQQIRYQLKESRNLGLNAKRVIQQSREFQYRPGSTAIDKTRLNSRKISEVLLEEARKRARVEFKLRDNAKPSPATKSADTKAPNKMPNPYPENADSQVQELLQWFKDQGSRKNWIMDRNEALFAKRLYQLKQGEPVDFLLWNCVGFRWDQDKPLGQPRCTLINNRAESLAVYYKSKLSSITYRLSRLGDTTLTVLVPSNEAFNQGYDSLGVYRQTPQERNAVLDDIVDCLQKDLEGIDLPSNIKLSVQRWDDYLRNIGITTPQENISESGIKLLQALPSFSSIRAEMIESGKNRFAGKLIVDAAQIEKLNLPYYGMYVGEGIALQGLNVVMLNFEELRVARLETTGASGELAIVTPIKPYEMATFYKWKNALITKRNSQS